VIASALINGETADSIPVTDRGLQYGDGVFETIAVVDGRLLCWEEHLTRLEDGCRRLNFSCPDRELLSEEGSRLADGNKRAVLKLALTRGSGGRGYAPPPEANPNRILSLHPWPDHAVIRRTEGVRTRICSARLARNPLLAGMKHLNRLEQVMARVEWNDPDVAEGLMLDVDGGVIEGTMCNLFVYSQGTLKTPDVSQAGVAGIIRGRVLALAAALNLNAMIAPLDLHDLEAAEELFLCNSIIGIWPICAIGERQYRPGPVTRSVREELIRRNCISPD